MNKAQVRVVDPVLSSIALGYKNPMFVGSFLFPDVEVPKSGVRVIKFDKAAFVAYNARRAPGAKTGRVQYGYASDPVALVQDSLEGKVPREWLRDTQDLPNVQHDTMAINNVMRSLKLALEIEQAGLACDANNYDANHKITLAAGEHWDDGGDPGAQMRTYKAAVRDTVGIDPNTLVLTDTDWDVLAENPIVKERFKYTSSDSLTGAMAAAYFEVPNVVKASALSAPSEDGELSKVWTASVLAYVPPQADRNMGSPSFGYNYHLPQHPLAEESYYERNEKSWIYPVEYERRPYLTSMTAGFLIQGIKAP